MYTDLASLYERAGRIRGRQGSVTLLPILTMPDDDITHPIPDLTGYITEGQIVLSRQLHRRGIFPPIDVLRSLSPPHEQRHRDQADAGGPSRRSPTSCTPARRAQETRRLVAIVGEASLSDADRRLLAVAEEFERRFVHQGGARRTIDETLDLVWDLLRPCRPSS